MPSSSSSSSSSSAFRTSEQERITTRVKEIMAALQQCQALTRTKETYTTRLQDVIRMTVRTTVGEFAVDNVVVKPGAVQSVSMGASAMTLPRFLDCLDLIFEQLLLLLNSASSVNDFLIAEGLRLHDSDSSGITTAGKSTTPTDTASPSATAEVVPAPPPQLPLASVIVTALELISKSISELLRLRKDAHSLVTLSEMKAIWDSCMTFANQLDKLGGDGSNSTGHPQHTSALRTALLAQVKLFVERRHESNMSSLAAALDSERWVQCEVSVGRHDAVTRLCSGLSMTAIPLMKRTTTSSGETDGQISKHPELEVEGTRYKVVWSCLLLIEMILGNIATAAHFQSIATNNVSKVSELLRLFNSRTTQLVLGAGAIHSHAKLKSINAKHLSLVTQCLGVVMAIIPHVRAGLMTQLPKKQHMLLNDLDQIRKEYNDHNEKVLNKFVSIIGGIVEHSLARTIPNIDFDERAKAALENHPNTSTTNGDVSCCVFLEGVATNIRKMHQVLFTLLPPDHLIDTFSRIFAFVDTKVPALFIAAANIQPVFQQQSNSSNGNNSPDSKGLRKGQPTFVFPKTNEGKRQFLIEVEAMTKILNGLDGVRPWDFAAINVIERQLEYSMNQPQPPLIHDVDTDSNPASETVSISDDVLSTSGDGENTNTDATAADTAPKTEKGDASSTTMMTSTVLVEDSDNVPMESMDTDTTPLSTLSSPEVDSVTAVATTTSETITPTDHIQPTPALLSTDTTTTPTSTSNTAVLTTNGLLEEKNEQSTVVVSTDDNDS
jgi:vacuolar protein sorting-associated protein 54